MLNTKNKVKGWDDIKTGDVFYTILNDHPYSFLSQLDINIRCLTNLNEIVNIKLYDVRIVKNPNYESFKWIEHTEQYSRGLWFDPVQDGGVNKKVDNGYGIKVSIPDSLETIVINEDSLDLHKHKPELPQAQLPISIDNYDTLNKVYIDIETTGLSPANCRITMIGLRNETGVNIVITHHNEKVIIQRFIDIIRKKAPKLLFFHNGYNFDIPFINHRSGHHGLPQLFEPGTVIRRQMKPNYHGAIKRCFSNEDDSLYGGSVTSYKTADGVVIDTMLLLGLWDIGKKLPNLKLKPSVIALKLRKDTRVELTNDQIQKCWVDGDIATLSEYLIDDLEDTEMIANFLMPSIWYQQSFIPNVEIINLAYKNTGYKIQKMFEYLYPNAPESDFEVQQQYKDDKCEYGGGLTGAITGIYYNVAKIDVNSLYPSIMCRYGLTTRKDKDNAFISILTNMLTDRLVYKKEGKNGNTKSVAMAEAIKFLMNSSYGFLGNAGYSYNDMLAAAYVTGYGRRILRLMCDTIVELGATIVSIDTDGVYFSSKDYQHVFDTLSSRLPEGITIDLEKKDLVMFSKSKKNYCLYDNEGNLVDIKGNSFLSNYNKLERDFIANYPRLLVTKSFEAAELYYNDIIDKLQNNLIPLSNIVIKTTILKEWKEKQKILKVKAGDVVSYYYIRHDQHEQKHYYSNSRKYLNLPVLENNGLPYFAGYYQWTIDNIRAEFLGMNEPEKVWQDMPKTIAKKQNLELKFDIC